MPEAARHHADEPCTTQPKRPSHRRPRRHPADQDVDSHLHLRRCLQPQVQRRSTTTSTKNNNASTYLATPTTSYRKPHEVPSEEPHPYQWFAPDRRRPAHRDRRSIVAIERGARGLPSAQPNRCFFDGNYGLTHRFTHIVTVLSYGIRYQEVTEYITDDVTEDGSLSRNPRHRTSNGTSRNQGQVARHPPPRPGA